ncbi:general secretion pathway protein GspB [Vibrio japonicus]|uniref:General secretion pathway protein GspB n=1 Tax=Vibrio japonicus TaxID=1824638 RepID=A0ABY5LHU5_9VIBR|nr:general secretion pathway protein GspB [Vibrio japonicus]UUM31031.1 general secretion pathway protein GspB [Vibrio japonicus]
MSRVMKALEQSEQNYQSASYSPLYHPQQTPVQEQKVNKLLVCGLLIGPALFVSAFNLYPLYQTKQAQWKERVQQEEITLDVPFTYEVKEYPSFGKLQATYELTAPVYEEPTPVAPPAASNVGSSKKTEHDSLLGDLDLSQLSPELASHVQAVLGNDAPSRVKAKANMTNISTDGDKWYGKLPAMNFETHVYSSSPAKRWVKINGREYKEGDWITDAIQLEKIEQQSSLLSINGEKIEVPALYDWKG